MKVLQRDTRAASHRAASHFFSLTYALFLALVPGLAAMVPVEVRSHEDTRTANRRLFAQARHLVVSINLVELEDGELHLLVLVRDLLRLRVHFLLALLGAAVQS